MLFISLCSSAVDVLVVACLKFPSPLPCVLLRSCYPLYICCPFLCHLFRVLFMNQYSPTCHQKFPIKHIVLGLKYVYKIEYMINFNVQIKVTNKHQINVIQQESMMKHADISMYKTMRALVIACSLYVCVFVIIIHRTVRKRKSKPTLSSNV